MSKCHTHLVGTIVLRSAFGLMKTKLLNLSAIIDYNDLDIKRWSIGDHRHNEENNTN